MFNSDAQNPVRDSPDRAARWGQNRRLEFIDFRLFWEGRINRADITRFFRISVPQASLDLARYLEIAPENATYDRSNKVYVATDSFAPRFATPTSSHYLNQLLAVQSQMMSEEMSFLGWYPAFGAVLSPSRTITPSILFRVLRAIRYERAIEITYQSLSRPDPTIRKISPHAIAYDGTRWHTRAYCHTRQKFLDFVFARIQKVSSELPTSINPTEDRAWNTVVSVKIKPHPALPDGQKRAIELDYGMKNGSTTIESKQALLFYLLRRLRLEKENDAMPHEQQIVLENRAEVESFLPKD